MIVFLDVKFAAILFAMKWYAQTVTKQKATMRPLTYN